MDVRDGDTTAVVTGLPPTLLQGVTRIGKTFVLAVGEAEPGTEPRESDLQASALYVARKGGEPRLLADHLAYELERNPDGQRQFDRDGMPLDALSKPLPRHRG